MDDRYVGLQITTVQNDSATVDVMGSMLGTWACSINVKHSWELGVKRRGHGCIYTPWVLPPIRRLAWSTHREGLFYAPPQRPQLPSPVRNRYGAGAGTVQRVALRHGKRGKGLFRYRGGRWHPGGSLTLVVGDGRLCAE